MAQVQQWFSIALASALALGLAAGLGSSGASAYDVVGVAKAKVRWQIDKYPGPVTVTTGPSGEEKLVETTNIVFYQKFMTYEVIYEAFILPNNKWSVKTFIDYEWYEEERRETTSTADCHAWPSNQRKTGTHGSTRKVYRKYAGPGQEYTFDQYPHRLLELRPATTMSLPISIDESAIDGHIALSGVQAAGPFQESWQESEQTGISACGKSVAVPLTRTHTNWPMGPSSSAIIATIPAVIKPPIGAPHKVTIDLEAPTVRDLNIGTQGTVLEYANLNLTVVGLPVPVAKVSDLSPPRASPVTFDASGSSGEYRAANWVLLPDRDACLNPRVITTDGPAQGLSASAIRHYLKNNSLTVTPYEIMVRKPGEPDRFTHTTPLLCPLKARLFLTDEKSGIRVSSDEIQVNVKPRDGWSTDSKDQPAGQVSLVAVVADGKSAEVGLAEFMNVREAAAMNVPSFCVFGGTYYYSDACSRAVFDELGLKKVLGLSSLGAVANANGGPRDTLEMFGKQYNIKIGAREGPFSDYYYFESLDDKLFNRSLLYHPNIPRKSAIRGMCKHAQVAAYLLLQSKFRESPRSLNRWRESRVYGGGRFRSKAGDRAASRQEPNRATLSGRPHHCENGVSGPVQRSGPHVHERLANVCRRSRRGRESPGHA